VATMMRAVMMMGMWNNEKNILKFKHVTYGLHVYGYFNFLYMYDFD